MGKYDRQLRESDGDSAEIYYGRALLIVANELAEANRLKRIELENQIDHDDVAQFQIRAKELEDQA